MDLVFFSDWTDHSPKAANNILFSLNGNSSLVLEYYENGGQNVVGFTNFVQFFSNTLSQNLNQHIYTNSVGVAISGDIFTSLPSGISPSGTGYQWAYSSASSNGPWINIEGAVSATFTPVATEAPFNSEGVYYIIRKATFSGINNISPNPFVTQNESNYAVLTVKIKEGTWLGKVNSEWNNPLNWSGGIPIKTSDVIITSGALYQPMVNTSDAICNNLTISESCTLTIQSAKQLIVYGVLTNNAGTSGLILQSDETGSASIVHSTDNIEATFNLLITGKKEAWHLLSSPVTHQIIEGDWIPSGTYGNGTGYDLYVWDEATSCWIYHLNATNVKNWNIVHPETHFVAGRGYLYSVEGGNLTKQFKGILNNREF